jgi:hypothetical protein
MDPFGTMLLLAAVPAQAAPVFAGPAMATLGVGATVIRPETVSAPGVVRAGNSMLIHRAEGVRITVEGGSVRPAGRGASAVTAGRAGHIVVTLTY